MKTADGSFSKLSITTFILVGLVAFGIPMWGQEAPPPTAVGNVQVHGLPEDWTHHHVVFSNPGTEQEAIEAGAHEKWLTIVNDRRYVLQQLKRNLPAQGPAADDIARIGRTSEALRSNEIQQIAPALAAKGTMVPSKNPAPKPTTKPQGDWNTYLGGTTGAGINPTMYPAKYTWNINATPNCANDFLVVPVNQPAVSGANATGSITLSNSCATATSQGVTINGIALNVASGASGSSATFTFTGEPSGGDTVTIGSVTYTWETTCGSTSNCISRSSYTGTDASNLVNAIGGTCGGTGTCTADTNFTAVRSQNGTYPFDYVVTVTAKCLGPSSFSASYTPTGNSRITVSTVAVGSGGTASGTTFALGSTDIATASNLATVITNQTSSTLVTAATGGTNVITLTPNSGGAAGDGTLSSSFNSGVTVSGITGGVDGQATLLAFNNLYAGAAVAATQVGTVSSNGATGGSITIGSTTLTASAPTQATGLVTISINPTNTQDVYIQIDGKTADEYAFHDSLADCGSAKCVLIGATATASATNLANAIMGSCLNLCTAADPYVTATSNGAVVTLKAITAGTSGNSIGLAALNNTRGDLTVSGADLGTGTGTVAGSWGTTAGTQFAYYSSTGTLLTAAQLAANIESAINTNTATDGVTATLSGAVITIAANAAGANGTSLSASLPGFAWGGSTLVGGTAAGSCTGPTVMWAYNASSGTTGSKMLGSPILSFDGTKVAFIESVSNGTSSESVLHILRPKSADGTLGGPAVPPTSTSTGSTYTTCLAGTTSCMFNLVLSTGSGTTDTYSPPFYFYNTDTLWVGNDAGVLYEITGVFNGVPAMATGAWATGVKVSSSPLTGPVFDYTGTWNVLVADTAGTVRIVTSAGTVGASHSVTGPITDPIVEDASTGMIYVFSGGNGVASSVTQLPVALTSAQTVAVGGLTATGNSQVHAGAFNNAYWTSPSTGLLYVCGEGTGSIGPALYAINFTGNTMNAVANGPLALTTTATTAGQCSPLGEVYNTTTDWLFTGVPASCAFGGSATGCIMAFEITNGFPDLPFATAAENGGTSGIIIDNVSNTAQNSSTYFTTLTSPGAGGCTGEPAGDSTNCLVKRTQAGLQ